MKTKVGETFSGHRGLDFAQPLIFEQDTPGITGVDLPAPSHHRERLGSLRRSTRLGLPGLSEPDVVRHYTRLSQKNYSIDSGFYPLGSCTMKHNPRLNEKMARLPGFADLHPFQPVSTVQGALKLIDRLAWWLKELTGLPAVAMTPAAGAHGELCGLMCIRAALEAEGGAREVVLVPDSAHGTNPATAALVGYRVESIPATLTGRLNVEAVKERLGPDVAAVMITNPNTCGLFESDALEVADAVHDAGAYFYMDGANFNAIVGRVRLYDLGVDAMHINLHKTFSAPHGGGGPGAGPTVLSKELASYAPVPFIIHDQDGFRIEEHSGYNIAANSYGRMKGFHGQFGVFVRSLAYIMSLGIDGLKKASGDAVLNANYLLARLSQELTPSFPGSCMHEALFDDRFLEGTGVTTLDFSKAMIDEGFHPMTMYFPLVVHGAMLMEPTETESKATLDQFVHSILCLARKAKAGETNHFTQAPRFAPLRRLDETRAARAPILRWKPEELRQAAE